MKLVVVSQTPHYLDSSGRIFGWSATVDELDALSELFEEIVHVAWAYPGRPPAVTKPYSLVRCALVPASGGQTILAKVGILRRIPGYIAAIVREVRRSDVVHVRCPSSIGLMGLLVVALSRRPRRRWAKYAGNWQGREKEPLSYRLQRALLRRGIHRGPVTVNGRSPDDRAHVLTFHNPSVHAADLERATNEGERQLAPPYRLLFVGRVERAKGVHDCVSAVQKLVANGTDATLDVIGDGPMRKDIQSEAERSGLGERVRFHGWIGRDRLEDFYSSSHLFVLPSRSEGWPKVVGEAMAFGTVPIVTAVSSIASVLEEAGGGTALPSPSPDALVHAIRRYLDDPAVWVGESLLCRRAASWFTYDRYVEEIDKMLMAYFGLDTKP